jgi:hypothetical protein
MGCFTATGQTKARSNGKLGSKAMKVQGIKNEKSIQPSNGNRTFKQISAT